MIASTLLSLLVIRAVFLQRRSSELMDNDELTVGCLLVFPCHMHIPPSLSLPHTHHFSSETVDYTGREAHTSRPG